jgi:VWFA-related protein
MEPLDRAAVYTVSGRVTVDFTDDRESLRRALDRVHGKLGLGAGDCLELNDHLADLIERGNREALAAAVQLVQSCQGLDSPAGLSLLVRTAATHRAFESQMETRAALTMLRNVIRRMGVAPGQRTVVLISEGFIIPTDRSGVGDVLEAAAHADVVVNSLNSRGLIAYAPLNCPASASCAGRPVRAERNFEREGDAVDDDALAVIAEGTGGRRFHNNNDYDAAFRLLAAAPEFHYVLGFTPQDLKLDGKFHPIKVALAHVKGVELTARAGYYAVAAIADPEEAARQEIHAALYYRGEIGGIPFDLRSRAYQSPDGKDTLEVAAYMDPKDLRMRSEGGLNIKPLTIAFGVFDRDGKIMATTRKDVGLRIRDLDLKMNSGRWVGVKTTFALKAGAYTVRVVVRDGDEHLVSAVSRQVEVGRKD